MKWLHTNHLAHLSHFQKGIKHRGRKILKSLTQDMDIINQVDWADIHRACHPITVANTFFAGIPGPFPG